MLRRKNEANRYVYAAYLNEKEFNDEMHRDKHFFTSYEGAYQYLKKEKQKYLSDKYLKDCMTVGAIQQIKLDEMDRECVDNFYFDNDLRLVLLIPTWQIPGISPTERLGDPFPWGNFEMYIPVPFKTGDIVKVESLFFETRYGVFSHEWKRPQRPSSASFNMSLDMYDSTEKRFWHTDDTSILKMEYCTDEELPENESVLKVLSEVRKGEIDFFVLLESYEKLNELFGPHACDKK